MEGIKKLVMLLAIRADIEGMICEREGMKADNKVAEFNHHPIPYTYTDFFILQEKLIQLSESLKKEVHDN